MGTWRTRTDCVTFMSSACKRDLKAPMLFSFSIICCPNGSLICDFQIKIVRAHHMYSDEPCKPGIDCTLIFSVLHYSTHQAILCAARKDLLSINGLRICFSPDDSNFTVKRRQALHQAMDTAPAKGLEFSSALFCHAEN